jgi:hypothetical protein
MKLSRRLVSALLIAAIVLFLGMLFWPFVFNNLIKPIASVVWLLLRILVLSIHQKYFWYALIAAAFVVLIRLLPWEQPMSQPEVYLESNATFIKIGYWRSLCMYTDHSVQEEKTLKKELIHLLTSLYAAKRRTSNKFKIYEGLERGEIPLPENIHTFLFSQEPKEPGGRIKTFFRSMQKTLRTWIRRWTGQEKAEHFQRIEEVLHFMETSLEIKHDGRTLSQDKH